MASVTGVRTSVGGVRGEATPPTGQQTAYVDPAAALIEAARVGDRVAMRRILARPDLPRIAAQLAEHLAVLTPAPLRGHGTHAAFNRHKNHGEQPCVPCVEGERVYQRLQKIKQRGAQVPLLPVIAVSNLRNAGTPEEFLHTLPNIDPVAVERACNGDTTVTLTRPEKVAALQQLLAAGHNKTEAATRLRLSGKTVNELLESSLTSPSFLVSGQVEDDDGAEQGCSPARPLTDSPASTGAAFVSIATDPSDSFGGMAV